MRQNRGFTVIELLVVITVIAILIAMTLPNLFSAQLRARDDVRKSDLRTIQAALESYHSDKASYPTTEQGLIGLEPEYLSVVPSDPKGKSYTYTSDGQT